MFSCEFLKTRSKGKYIDNSRMENYNIDEKLYYRFSCHKVCCDYNHVILTFAGERYYDSTDTTIMLHAPDPFVLVWRCFCHDKKYELAIKSNPDLPSYGEFYRDRMLDK